MLRSCTKKQVNWDVLLGSSSDEGEDEGDNDEDAIRKPRPLPLGVTPIPKRTGAPGGALEKPNPLSAKDGGAVRASSGFPLAKVTPPSTKDVEAVRALWQGFGLKEAERCEKSNAHLPANYPGRKGGPDSSPGPNAADLGIAPGNLHRMGGGNFKPVNYHRLIKYQRNGSLLNRAAAPKFRVSAYKSAHSLPRSSASRVPQWSSPRRTPNRSASSATRASAAPAAKHPNVVADRSLDTADTLTKSLNTGPHALDATSGQEPSNAFFSRAVDAALTRAPAVPSGPAQVFAEKNGWNKPRLATAADLVNLRNMVDEPAKTTTPPDNSVQGNKSTDTDNAEARERLESEIGILRSQLDRQREQLVLAEEHRRASAVTWRKRDLEWENREQEWESREQQWELRDQQWEKQKREWENREQEWTNRMKAWEKERQDWEEQRQEWAEKEQEWQKKERLWERKEQLWDQTQHLWERKEQLWEGISSCGKGGNRGGGERPGTARADRCRLRQIRRQRGLCAEMLEAEGAGAPGRTLVSRNQGDC